ncbi:flagellar basal body rod protein FlgB [Oscillospiraceae bacterium MB08-C2-2]|nr:flagellar basal body rod protein FlgB [Oscillospiraceae bacterium MB08-C2-2]
MINSSIPATLAEKSLSAQWQKMQLVMHNIANEDTPGYKAKRMEFENILQKELTAARSAAAPRSQLLQKVQEAQPYVYEDNTTSIRADGSNVDIDSEHVELARIQIQYQALQQKISAHYSSLKYAITGGR